MNSADGSTSLLTQAVFNNFVHERTKNPDRDLLITLGVKLLSDGKPVDIKILSKMTTGRYKRNAAKQAVRYLQRHFAGQVSIENDSGVTVLVPRGEA